MGHEAVDDHYPIDAEDLSIFTTAWLWPFFFFRLHSSAASRWVRAQPHACHLMAQEKPKACKGRQQAQAPPSAQHCPAQERPRRARVSDKRRHHLSTLACISNPRVHREGGARARVSDKRRHRARRRGRWPASLGVPPCAGSTKRGGTAPPGACSTTSGVGAPHRPVRAPPQAAWGHRTARCVLHHKRRGGTARPVRAPPQAAPPPSFPDSWPRQVLHNAGRSTLCAHTTNGLASRRRRSPAHGSARSNGQKLGQPCKGR